MTSAAERRRRIAVIGPGEADAHITRLAQQVGQFLGWEGCDVYTGGLGGVMEAAARGASQAGGLTIGILPGEEASDANTQIRVAVATGLGEGRNLVLVRSVEALIAVGRGYGTLSEIAFALRLQKRVVGLDSWDVEGMLQTSSPEEAVQQALR
ncbi:MAG TPA: TIGR00725 family protein [Chloroflexota bacterium]|nr:TIGR00725 family protein [Chloroflexota bacterium]